MVNDSGFSHEKMVIFHSYVSLPEGITYYHMPLCTIVAWNARRLQSSGPLWHAEKECAQKHQKMYGNMKQIANK